MFGPKKSWSEKMLVDFLIEKTCRPNCFQIIFFWPKNRPIFFQINFFLDQKFSTIFFIWWLSKKIDQFFFRSQRFSDQNPPKCRLREMHLTPRILICTANPGWFCVVWTVSRSSPIFVQIRVGQANLAKKLSHPCIFAWNEHTYNRQQRVASWPWG